jgi:DNA polymerase (family 10)
LSEIFASAKELGKILEINSSPDRTDLSSPLIKRAISAGVKLMINTDAHTVESMRLMQYGVYNARRGWATRKDIVNTQVAFTF